ncbi:AMP-binding protein [Streptomyces sp. NPDC046909]|uniref:AMP-binding protein n=1 Tax=Streptomyces sp. NPDC046909 TaxID=3155617 RepID=UPI0034093437
MQMPHSLTLGDVASENRRSRPLATAVVDGEVRLTYEQLDARVDRLASVLRDEGVEVGDRLLWVGRNSFRILECLLAAARVGAVFCPVNWRQSADELTFVMDDFTPRVVIWEQAAVGDTAMAARGASATRTHWIRADGPADDNEYEARLSSVSTPDPAAEREIDPASPCLALYTAAFSGRPNAALLSHTGILTHNMSLALVRQIEPGFVYLNCGPLFHVGTMMFCTATFHLGGTNVFMPAFDAAEACRLVEAERCESMLLFPPMSDQLLEACADGRYDLSSLRAPAGSDAWNAAVTVDDSPWGRALGGYGQSEVGGMLTYGGLGLGGLGTHGRPSPFAQVRIVDPEGRELPPEEVGEIVARGPHVMYGYHERPELNTARRSGGWHHTGDLARREKDGTITFIGPKVRMIKSGGENIYPAEVERCITAHPDVAECAVIGVPDARWGQSVKAVVALRDGARVTEQDITDHCRDRIASYKKPQSVEFVDAVPRRGFTPDYDELDARFGGGGYPIF